MAQVSAAAKSTEGAAHMGQRGSSFSEMITFEFLFLLINGFIKERLTF